MVVELIKNAALLITLSAFFGAFTRARQKKIKLYNLFAGFWFGMIAIAGMMMPFHYQPGAIFDGRSIILTLAGLFGGGIPAVISVIIAGSYRFYLGGPGVWAGVATIISCAVLGYYFRHINQHKPEKLDWHDFLVIGILAHVVMLLCQLLFPWPTGIAVIKNIWFPVMLVFPLAFVFTAFMLRKEVERVLAMQDLSEAETLYRATLYSIGDAVITTDKQTNILHMNPMAEQLTGWTEKEATGVALEEVFRVIREETGNVMESTARKVLKDHSMVGLANHTLLLSRDGRKIPITDSGAPIKNKEGDITGVVMVFRDQHEEREKQRKLEQSEAKYRDLVESTDAIAWEFDLELDSWTYVAPQVTGILGWEPQDWTNMEFWVENIHPSDKEWVVQSCLQSTEKGEDHTLEYRFETKTGDYKWLRDVISVELLESKPVKLRGIMLDITNRKEIEIELRDKNNFIQTVLDHLPIGIALNNIEEGIALYMNHQFEKIYGWNSEVLTGIQSFFKHVYPDDDYRNELTHRIMADIQSGDPARMHWENIKITRQDGSKGIVNAVNIPLLDQNIMVSTVMDVTERRKAEIALQESEEEFRRLFEDHSAVHLLIDPDNGDIVNANQAAANYYGWSIGELKTMKINQINILSPEEIGEAMERARLSRSLHFEFKHRLSNGEIRDVEVFSSKVDLKKKQYLHSIVHDVTEKKQLVRDLILAKEKAEESDRLKSAFLANMSHEIRTPLNGILGFTDILTQDDIPRPKREEYGAIINRSAENLMQIINDILDLSKLETGQVKINKKSVSLNKMLQHLNMLYQKKMHDKGIQSVVLRLLPPLRPVVVETDENRLSQILMNLLDNALKFTKEGTVSFGVSGILENRVEFVVMDTGIGIEREKQSIIFDRFAQANEEISINYGGTGLGLSIVKKLVELLGGTIDVESEPGHGAVFTVSLPLEQQASIVEEGKEVIDFTGSKETIRVLLVEDDPTNMAYFKEKLRQDNIDLLVADTGKKAIELATRDFPDVILMDIRLPDISGWEVVKEIRKTNRESRIIAQTAYAMSSDEERSIEAGCNDFLAKPVKKKDLLDKINFLGRGRK